MSTRPPVQLRRATAADLPALAALYAESARRLGPQVYSPEQVAAWARFAADEAAFRRYVLGAETWLAETAGDVRPCGFCGVGAGDPAEPRLGEVHSLYVRADLSRRGLGTQLLAHALAQARSRGIGRFGAWATPFSRPLFERAGLHLVATVREPFQGVLFERYRVETG